MPETTSITRQQMVSGSMWMVGMRWGMRSIGLVSTAILARVLVPEDFGIVAMGTMTMALIHTFSELGTARLLIRLERPERSHYDTAWTIILVQGFVIAVLLSLCAPLAARYFHEPRLIPVIRWLASTSLIAGFANIGVIAFRKELRFRTDFRFGLACKLSSFAMTVGLALYLRSYWALVAGAIAAEIATVLLSYYFHEYRPRLCLHRWREFVSFSLWITPSNIAGYFIQRTDALVVGAFSSTSQLGLYHFASELSKMATNEVVVPMGRALYPSYAKLLHDRARLADAFRNVVRTIAILCFAIGPGLAVVAEDFVYVVLGDKWVFAIPLMRFLAITGALSSIVFVLKDQIFVVTGNERFSFAFSVVQLSMAVPSLVLVGLSFGPNEVAATTTCLAAAYVFLAAANVHRAVPISFREILSAFARPFAAACFMVVTVRLLHIDAPGVRALTLAVDIAVGAISYSLALLSLWKLAGRPTGVEETIVDYVHAVVASKLAAWRKLRS